MKYGMLLYPHANSRYYESMKKLGMNEFRVMTAGFDRVVENIRFQAVGGVELLCFETDELDKKHIEIVHSISCCFILFEILNDRFLSPVNDDRKTYFREDMSGILKYKGKTNEMFTELMINIGVFSSDFLNDFDKPLNVLDPLCGKGTTLFQGLIKGYNVAGVEVNRQDIKEINAFLKRYLEYHRYKHNTACSTIVLNGRKCGAKYIFETADTAENYKKKERRTVQFVHGDTVFTDRFYPAETFHTIVADLPYGVQHAGKNGMETVKTPELIKDSLEAWNKTLKKGGTIVLSFNTNTLKRLVLEKLISDFDFLVITKEPYKQFEHWVEQAVNRDILVAKKRGYTVNG